MYGKSKLLLAMSGLCLLAILIFMLLGKAADTGYFVTGFFVLLALAFQDFKVLKGFSFTILIFAAVSTSMYYPSYFVKIGTFDLKKLIVPLLQVIMFGMGTAMSVKDFYRVVKMPKGVLVGLLCQFTIMPLLGYAIATVFGFPPEIAAGIILIGASPGGLASNVMAYLAKANVALSVTLTAVATTLAPFITPLLMEFLAGAFVPIDATAMMLSILKIVILPVVIGLLFNHFLHDKMKWLNILMPKVSMAGIALIIMIITAVGRDNLLTVGIFLIVAAVIHNSVGYFLGYWGCRLFKMKEEDCRTIAFEVGMQNGGLASGIALEMGKVATLGLAPAVFGPWMNISGSCLAIWWRNKKQNLE